MSSFIKAKWDGSLKIDVQNKLFERVKKSRVWFNDRRFGFLMMLLLAFSDMAGFWQIADDTLIEYEILKVLTVVAFTAAFELAPLYLGYAICLKCYDFGKDIRNVVWKLSLWAFLTGIIVNGIYRFMTKDVLYTTGSLGEYAVTFLMTFLPVITSLVNMVIGCLVFDPLYIDLIKLKKRLSILQEKKRQLEVRIEEIKEDDKLDKILEKEIKKEYDDAKVELNTAKKRLMHYVEIISTT